MAVKHMTLEEEIDEARERAAAERSKIAYMDDADGAHTGGDAAHEGAFEWMQGEGTPGVEGGVSFGDPHAPNPWAGSPLLAGSQVGNAASSSAGKRFNIGAFNGSTSAAPNNSYGFAMARGPYGDLKSVAMGGALNIPEADGMAYNIARAALYAQRDVSGADGHCLAHVEDALQFAGYDLRTKMPTRTSSSGTPTHWAKDAAGVLSRDPRFEAVATGFGGQMQNENYRPQAGDVVVWTGGPYGHIMIAGADRRDSSRVAWQFGYQSRDGNWTGLRNPESHGQFVIFRQKLKGEPAIAANDKNEPKPEETKVADASKPEGGKDPATLKVDVAKDAPKPDTPKAEAKKNDPPKQDAPKTAAAKPAAPAA